MLALLARPNVRFNQVSSGKFLFGTFIAQRGGLLRQDVKELLEKLPVRVLNKIRALSKKTGETPALIVEKGINLYERKFAGTGDRLLKKGGGRYLLATHIADPEKRRIFSEVMKTLATKAAATTAEKLGAEGRTARAKKAAAKRWEKKSDGE